MQKIKMPGIVMVVLFIFSSCKKDNDNGPVFSATGYWRGYISTPSVTLGIGVLNKENGACRIYDLANGPDTTNVDKHDGTYAVTGDFYRGKFAGSSPGDSTFVETTSTSPRVMTGIIAISGQGAGPFELIKQP